MRLFLEVLAAVAHAHSNLILHRDLKPSEHPGHARKRQVKLLDFGIAKLHGRGATALGRRGADAARRAAPSRPNTPRPSRCEGAK